MRSTLRVFPGRARPVRNGPSKRGKTSFQMTCLVNLPNFFGAYTEREPPYLSRHFLAGTAFIPISWMLNGEEGAFICETFQFEIVQPPRRNKAFELAVRRVTESTCFAERGGQLFETEREINFDAH